MEYHVKDTLQIKEFVPNPKLSAMTLVLLLNVISNQIALFMIQTEMQPFG